jgi:hypothetical protein
MQKEALQPHTKGAQLVDCLPTHLNVPRKQESQDQENQHYQLTTLATKSTFATNHNINTMTMLLITTTIQSLAKTHRQPNASNLGKWIDHPLEDAMDAL